jgi:hypothetical protein
LARHSGAHVHHAVPLFRSEQDGGRAFVFQEFHFVLQQAKAAAKILQRHILRMIERKIAFRRKA